MTIPDNITPAELRREAEKRELIGRWNDAMEKRQARNEVTDAIVAMVEANREAFSRSDAGQMMAEVIRKLSKADLEADEHLPTNGEINSAGQNWWSQREKLEKPETHALFERIRKNNWTPYW